MRVRAFIDVDTRPDPHPYPSPGGRGVQAARVTSTRYIKNAVMTKSIISVAIEENTTVRVVA